MIAPWRPRPRPLPAGGNIQALAAAHISGETEANIHPCCLAPYTAPKQSINRQTQAARKLQALEFFNFYILTAERSYCYLPIRWFQSSQKIKIDMEAQVALLLLAKLV